MRRCVRGRSRVRILAWLCCLIGVGMAGPAPRLLGQEANGQGGEEIRLLREAAAREAVGDMAGAEQILRTVLATRPTSLPALLSFERVLRIQGRLSEVLPVVDRLLAEDKESAIGHQLRIRILSDLNRVDEIEAAVEEWVRATPKLETPYRESARVWQGRGNLSRALAVLERGRQRVGRDDALALELGDTYAASGDDAKAVREWDRAVGADGRGFTLVRRRLAAAPDGGARLLPALIDALTRSPISAARQRAAAELAIDAGLGARAERIARQVALGLTPTERRSFLIEMARRADGAHLPSLAYWAYTELLAEGGPDQQMLAVRSRLGDLALELGDTTAARSHYMVVEQAFAAGSPERRQAVAVRIELIAREGKITDALQEYGRYRQEYPEAPELDELAATLGGLLLEEGDPGGADRVLTGVSGPRSSLVRGRIALLQGDMSRARAAFLAAAPRLQGVEATETIALATLLGRLTPGGGELLAKAMAQIGEERLPDAIGLLVDGSKRFNRAERAAVLDFAAGLADRAELPEEAERIRRTLVTDLPDSQEAPAALLALARALVQRSGGVDEARAFLERLVLDYPRSALVPQARRELDRLQGRVPSTGSNAAARK